MLHRPVSNKAEEFKEEMEGDTVGYRITDKDTGKSLVYVPDMREITPLVLRKMDDAEVLIFDGTFYRDDELIRLGISEKTSKELGHTPMVGVGGSIEVLRELKVRHKLYTHLNNTNPAILEDSSERKRLHDEGFKVARDGEVIDL